MIKHQQKYPLIWSCIYFSKILDRYTYGSIEVFLIWFISFINRYFKIFWKGTIKHAFIKIFNNYCWKIIKIFDNEFFGYTISFFFYQGFLSLTLTIQRIEGRGPAFIPLYHFDPLTNIERFVWNFACEMTITYF